VADFITTGSSKNKNIYDDYEDENINNNENTVKKNNNI